MKTSGIIDLGEWAEADFSAKCARAGVTRNRSIQDRTGWDYLVEFEAQRVPGLPADLDPADMSVRVQVKSKQRGRPYVDLRLSNALRFARDPMPCFLVLYQATTGGEPVRIFARHIWTEEVAQALYRARKAGAEGEHELNKLTQRFSFSETDDHTDDLVDWMSHVIAGRGRYAEEKREILETVGFEEGRIHGTLTIAAEDLPALIDHQIGLNDHAPPMSITVVERRFGIDVALQTPGGISDTARMRSAPLPARVRIRPPDDVDIWLDAELYLPSAPAPEEFLKLRVVAGSLSLVLNRDFRGTVTLANDPDRQLAISGHRARIQILQLAASGPLRLMIASEGKPNIQAEVLLPGIEIDAGLVQFSNAIACIEKVGSGVLPLGLTVSQREIDVAWETLVDFNGMVAGTDFVGRL